MESDTLVWNISAKGNPYVNVDGWNVAVFKRGRQRKDGSYPWSYRTQRRSPSTDPSCTVAPYSVLFKTEEEAKVAALQSIPDLERRLMNV